MCGDIRELRTSITQLESKVENLTTNSEKREKEDKEHKEYIRNSLNKIERYIDRQAGALGVWKILFTMFALPCAGSLIYIYITINNLERNKELIINAIIDKRIDELKTKRTATSIEEQF